MFASNLWTDLPEFKMHQIASVCMAPDLVPESCVCIQFLSWPVHSAGGPNHTVTISRYYEIDAYIHSLYSGSEASGQLYILSGETHSECRTRCFFRHINHTLAKIVWKISPFFPQNTNICSEQIINSSSTFFICKNVVLVKKKVFVLLITASKKLTLETSRSKRKLLLISLCQFMICQIIKNTVEFPIQSMK